MCVSLHGFYTITKKIVGISTMSTKAFRHLFKKARPSIPWMYISIACKSEFIKTSNCNVSVACLAQTVSTLTRRVHSVWTAQQAQCFPAAIRGAQHHARPAGRVSRPSTAAPASLTVSSPTRPAGFMTSPRWMGQCS